MDLKSLQKQFLKAVVSKDFPDGIKQSMLPGGKLDELGCLNAYRNDYTSRLSSTLGDNFESLWTILGDEDFFKLCHEYILENPSKLYDLGEYGHKLPGFLKGHELAYLSELAQLEIEFRRLFNNAPLDALDSSSFTDLGDPSKIVFTISPLVFISKSEFPIYKIWENRGNNSEESFNQIEWIPENIVMYNSSGTVQMKFLTPFQVNMLSHLCDAQSLEESIDSSGEGNQEEVGDLFSFLVSNSLILNYK